MMAIVPEMLISIKGLFFVGVDEVVLDFDEKSWLHIFKVQGLWAVNIEH